MRKDLLQSGLLFLASQAALADELRGEIEITSNYVWRGITKSDDAPSVIGGFNYRHDRGLFALGHVASVRVDDKPEQLALLQGGMARPWRDGLVDAGVAVYEYTRGDQFDPATNALAPGTSNKEDFVELFVGVRQGHVRFRYYRSDDYLGSGKISNYYDFGYEAPFQNDARVILHFGFTDSSAIDDHASQVSDTAFGLAKGNMRFMVTNMADNEDGSQSRNPRFVISWRQYVNF